MREHDRLIARIRRIRLAKAASDEPGAPPIVDPDHDHVGALEARVTHLETLVQGLQDSVYRESSRQERRIAELEARIRPAALGKALGEDARARGL